MSRIDVRDMADRSAAASDNPPYDDSQAKSDNGMVANPEAAQENDPINVQRKRTTSKAAHTRHINRIRAALKYKASPTEIDQLSETLLNLYESCVTYHLQYCSLSGREDDVWLTRLEEDYNKINDAIGRYLEVQQVTEQPIEPTSSHSGRREDSTATTDDSSASSHHQSFRSAPLASNREVVDYGRNELPIQEGLNNRLHDPNPVVAPVGFVALASGAPVASVGGHRSASLRSEPFSVSSHISGRFSIMALGRLLKVAEFEL